MEKYQLINFKAIGDNSGLLVALEGSKNIPFDIKRVYYVFGTKSDVVRGKHAHRNLQQIIICVSGECDFILDDGKERETIHLNSPSKGLYLSSYIWREFSNFSSDCVVMVLASEHYDESDYITDYSLFMKESNNSLRQLDKLNG